MILDRRLDEARRFRRGETLLGLALELRLADEQREKHRRADHDVVAGDLRGAAGAQPLPLSPDASRQSAAQPPPLAAAPRRPGGGGVGVGGRPPLLPPPARPLATAAAG